MVCRLFVMKPSSEPIWYIVNWVIVKLLLSNFIHDAAMPIQGDNLKISFSKVWLFVGMYLLTMWHYTTFIFILLFILFYFALRRVGRPSKSSHGDVSRPFSGGPWDEQRFTWPFAPKGFYQNSEFWGDEATGKWKSGEVAGTFENSGTVCVPFLLSCAESRRGTWVSIRSTESSV